MKTISTSWVTSRKGSLENLVVTEKAQERRVTGLKYLDSLSRIMWAQHGSL